MQQRSSVALLFLAVACAVHADDAITGSVFGLDLGAASIKVAALKHNTTIDIVLNEQSRRKTPSVVGFRNGGRYVGDEAAALAPRFPSLMVPAPHRAAGVTFKTGLKVFQNAVPNGGLASLADEPGRGASAFEFRLATDPANGGCCVHAPAAAAEESNGRVSAEELAAMLVEYAAAITATDVGEKPAGVTIAIPHATPMRQRLALKQAANLHAGVSFLGFVHSLTAAAVQYGVARGGFGNATAYVVIVDVGASQSQAGLFRFDPPPARTPMQDALGTVTTIAVDSLPEDGSNAIDRCVAELIDAALVSAEGAANSIVKSPTNDSPETLHKLGQRRFALARAANSVKEGLSVNSVVQYTVEAATVDGADFTGSISRSEMEEQCAKTVASRVAEAAARVANMRQDDWNAVAARRSAEANESTEAPSTDEGAPVTTDESVGEQVPLLYVEVTGAGSRVAVVSSALAEALPDASGGIGHRLNTDDSVALGAAIAATRSTAFIRTRGFAVHDTVPCATSIQLSVDDAAGAVHLTEKTSLSTTHPRPLFATCTALPCRRSVALRVATAGTGVKTVPNTVSFTIQHADGYCVGGEVADAPRVRQTVTVGGIEDAVAKALNHTAHAVDELNVTCRVEFTLTADGLVHASAPSVRVSKPKPPAASRKGSQPDEDSGDAKDGADGAETKKKKKAKKAGKKTAKEAAEKRHVYEDLSFAGPPTGASAASAVPDFYFADKPRPLSNDAHAAAASALAHLKAAEASAQEAAMRKNDLETLLLMERDDARHQGNTAAVTLFQELAAWLETGRGSEEGCTAAEFEERRSALEAALAGSAEAEL